MSTDEKPDVTELEQNVLAALQKSDGRTADEIAKQLAVDEQAVLMALEHLALLGLVGHLEE